MSINIQNPKNPNPQNKTPKFAFIFQHIILLFFIIILTRQSQPINMNFRVKTTSTLNRKRIQIKSLHQLLKPNTVIAVPEDNLSEKIFHNSIIREKEGQGSKKPILKVRSKFEKYENYGEKLGKFRSTGSKGSLMNTSRELGDLEKSNQLKKRATMPHFRYRSLDLEERKETRTAKNPMWTAVHYQYSSSAQKPNQKQKNQQKHSSQRILPLPKQQYLKKGSNINKRVVINLLKLKLYKNTQQQAELEPDNNTIRNNEILQMIKIYKGYGQGDHRGIDNKGGISLSRNRRRIEQMYRSQKENGLEIKQFPFRNLNIELSVSAWRNRRSDGVPGSPPTSQLGIQ